MRSVFALIFLLTLPGLQGSLVPKPRSIKYGQGQLLVDVQTRVIADKGLKPQAEILTAALQKTTHRAHQFIPTAKVGRRKFKRAIRLQLINSRKQQFSRIQISASGATIYGSDLAGIVSGIQTFAQLLPVAGDPIPRAFIPSQTIEDWPELKRRIFHLDVSAHLFATDNLKSLINWLSFHKINELHLQLNGDPGWRMESLKFPKLHEVGSVRPSTPPYGDPTGSDSTEYGGYYPQEKLKELITHAESRAITVVPAFTVRKGATALIAAYPELGAAPATVAHTWKERQIGVLENEKTLEFFDTLFAEVASIFPAQNIRIEGGPGDFHTALGKIITKHKKTMLLSQEILTTDFSIYQRPKEAELLLEAKLESQDGFNPVAKVYQWKPAPLSQATLRTHYVHGFDKLNYQVFPRIAAFAEATWVPQSELNYEEFRSRLTSLDQRYRSGKVTAALVYDQPLGQTLHNTKVTSNISFRPGYQPGLIFDGKLDSFFWSTEGIKKDDHLTLEFPWNVLGTATVTTGKTGEQEGIIEAGIVELSPDGKSWTTSKKLFLGAATIDLAPDTRFLRIRATTSQKSPLIFGEVLISPVLLAPLHEESREVAYGTKGKNVNLTFKADFRDHPELRDEIEVARETFFENWLPLARRIGTLSFPDTSREFEIKPGEPGQLSDEDIKEWVLRRMIPQIQGYPVSSPLWFETGMRAWLLDDFSGKVSKAKFRDGGSETGAFLNWVADKYGEEIVIAISQDCRNGHYRDSIWKVFTRKSLDELGNLYRNGE